MFEIGVAILEKQFKDIRKKFNISKSFVDFVQVDVCDGFFVPSKTFASNGRKDSFLKFREISKKTTLELDMMVDLNKNTEKWLNSIILAKPKRVVIHLKSTDNFQIIFDFLEKTKIEVGLAVHLDYNLAVVFDKLQKYPFSFVQVMGIKKVGFGSQKFAPLALEIIKKIHKQFPKKIISVDGSVKVENVNALKKAGARRVASGSGIFHYDAGVKEAVLAMHENTR